MANRISRIRSHELLVRAQSALAQARMAGEAAAAEYERTAPRDANGNLVPVNVGWALVFVSALKPGLRKALLKLNAIELNHRGSWLVSEMSSFPKGLAAQSALANSSSCGAAAETLNRLIGDQGEFWVQFRDD